MKESESKRQGQGTSGANSSKSSTPKTDTKKKPSTGKTSK